MAQPVKGTTEAGRRRESRARETRRRIIEAGLRLFLDNGYVNTTVQGIAQEACVAPATIYQAFGTKHAVLAAALDITVAGDDTPLAVLDRDWVEDARREKNRGRQLRLIVEGASLIAARTSPLKEVLRDAAATEGAARELIREDHERRHRTQGVLVDLLIENRQLRAGIDRRRAVDTFFALVNSATYELLVAQRGWTLSEWQDWIADVIERQLFGDL
jgi:AcrR family transcriptional regulator